MKDTFVANQNAYLEMVLQQMTERVLQTISRFMARQGRPPQWNYEEKRNVWSLATFRRESYMECLVGSMNKYLRYDIIQVLLEEREQLSTSNPTLKYDETHSVVKNHGILRLI
ncbi:hypothetical protein T05_14920 [Trichinella murrelli]|uniref:Uncharacterized protein n=1 Tax=Trichinella murrelli TaxID=144512 RepID=A0A0V0T3M0_9BILA|nr:hypothetical protein T05_14920 [Trichinella murrelli]